MPVKKDANEEEIVLAETSSMENQTLSKALNVAVDEIKNYKLYVAKPFDNISETRAFIGDYIQETAQQNFAEADERISNGEEREKVLEDYISDEAFEEWLNGFTTGLQTASGLE